MGGTTAGVEDTAEGTLFRYRDRLDESHNVSGRATIPAVEISGAGLFCTVLGRGVDGETKTKGDIENRYQ